MSQIHIIDGQQDMILDFIMAENIIEDTHRKSLMDTLETYNFSTFANKRFSEFLEKRNRVIIPDEDGTLIELVIFEAHRYKDTDGYKAQVYTHASYLELKKANILRPSTFEGTVSQHGGRALNDTGWQIGVAEGEGTRKLTIENHTNPYEFLKHIAKEFELELRFRVEHNGNRITGRYVDLLERVGMWRGREVEFGKDLDGIRRIEKQDIVTALLGLGSEDDNGQRLEVLVGDEDALQRWGRIDEHGNLQHLIEPYEIPSSRFEMNEEEARQYTRTALDKRINTQITYETTIIDLENVKGMENKKIRFGDTIKIKDTTFNPPLYLEARVFEQDRSIKSKAKKDIKLGDFIEHTEEEVNAIWKQLQKQISSRVSYYEMAEYTYNKLTIDDKDETVFTEGKTFAEAVGIDAKEYAERQDAHAKIDMEQYADTISEQKAQSALDQAKIYAVAKTVYDNQMQQIANDIADRAPIKYVDGELRHAIDNLQVGGRNLLRNSRHETNEFWGVYGGAAVSGVTDDRFDRVLKITTPTTGGYFVQNRMWQYNNEGLVKDEYVTISFYIKGNVPGVYVGIRTTGTTNNITGFDQLNITSNWEKVILTKRVVMSTSDLVTSLNWGLIFQGGNDGEFYVANLQVEKGNKATDWSPAPEDMFDEIEKKVNGNTVYTIEQVDNMIYNTVSKTQYTADMGGIVQDLSDQSTRIGQNTEAIGLRAEITDLDNVEKNLNNKIGDIVVKADEVEITVKEVKADLDELEIGGENLLFGSKNLNDGSYAKWSTTTGMTSSTVEDYQRFVVTGSYSGAPHSYFWNENYPKFTTPLESNTIYTISVDVRTDASIFRVGFRQDPSSIGSHYPYQPSIKANEWFRHKYTFTIGNNVGERFLWLVGLPQGNGTYIEVKNWQLEKGNKATSWSLAREEELENYDISNRNLLLNSGTPITSATYAAANYDLTDAPTDGEWVTVVMKADLNSNKESFAFYNSGGNVSVGSRLYPSDADENGVYLLTFQWRTKTSTHDTSNTFLRVYHMPSNVTGASSTIHWIKLVRGKETSKRWYSAPEEINEVSGRVTATEASISTLAGEVALKASKSSIDSLTGRVDTAESQLNVLPDQISAKVSKNGLISEINAQPSNLLINFPRIKMTGELEAKHIKSLNGLNINNQFVVDASGNVRFGGNLQGATGTFSGQISTPKLYIKAPRVQDFEDFGISLETAQWQANINAPFRRTGFINFNTANDGLEIYRMDLSNNQKSLAGFSLDAEQSVFYGKSTFSPHKSIGKGGDIMRLEGGHSNHVYVEFARQWSRDAYIGIPSAGSSVFRIRSNDLPIHLTSGSGNFYIGSDTAGARIYSEDVYNRTYSNATNMHITNHGTLGRSTSARKYKLLEEPIKVDPYKILELQPKTWYDKRAAESYADHLNGWDDVEFQYVKRIAGLIAEDVQDAGLEQYVIYDDDGEVEGLQYDRIWTLLIPIVRDLKNELEELKNERHNL